MERIDDLQLNGLKVIQDTEFFSFGTDAVLLSDFVKLKKGDSVIDLGTGCGIIPFLLYGKNENIKISGLEIQEGLFNLTQKSLALNNLQEKINFVNGDIKEAYKYFGGQHEAVVSNPPYEKVNDGFCRLSNSHKIARTEILLSFEQLCKSASKLLKTGGSFYIVHRPSRLSELLCALSSHKLEPKIIRFVHPYISSEPKLVLICAKKERSSALRVMPPLILHENKEG